MPDLVVTCPKTRWTDWLAEGGCAGDRCSGEWGWRITGSQRPPIDVGDRLYVVAWNRLRGFAIVTRVTPGPTGGWLIWRCEASAVTIRSRFQRFHGWRRIWWDQTKEMPFPGWKTAGVGA